MKGERSVLQRMTDQMNLAGVTVPGQPLIEIAGDSRVLVENHFGVREYSRERIGIHVKFGVLVVCGCGLELIRMTREQVVISGQIACVSLHRGKKG